MNGCELLKCKYYNNGKCTSPHDTCIYQTPDALDGQAALEERDTLIVELQAENERLKEALRIAKEALSADADLYLPAYHNSKDMAIIKKEAKVALVNIDKALKGQTNDDD